MRIEDAMTSLVRAAKEAQRMDQFMIQQGYGNTPYAQIYGNIADAVYHLLDENVESFGGSLAERVLEDPGLSEEQCAYILATHTK